MHARACSAHSAEAWAAAATSARHIWSWTSRSCQCLVRMRSCEFRLMLKYLLGLTSHDKGEECIGGLRLQPLLDPVHACHHSLIRHVSWPSRWLAEHASQSRAAQPHVSTGRICRSCALLVRSDRADVAVGEGYIAYGAARARFCSCGPCWWALWCARGAPLPFRCGAGVTVSACVPTSWPSHAFGEPTGPAPPLSHMYRCSATCTLAADEPVTRSTGHTGTSTL